MPKCPECGKDLEGIDVKAHALDHWPETIEPTEKHKEAIARQKVLLAGGVE